MQINFLADSDLEDFTEAIFEYEAIWNESGLQIITTWEEVTHFKFREGMINAIIFNEMGPSRSHPLYLRGNLDKERKASVFIHELGHRVLLKRMTGERTSLENHKTLFLVLFEVFEKIFGRDFADRAVAWDKALPNPEYKEAWDWALSIPEEDRQSEFRKRTIPI